MPKFLFQFFYQGKYICCMNNIKCLQTFNLFPIGICLLQAKCMFQTQQKPSKLLRHLSFNFSTYIWIHSKYVVPLFHLPLSVINVMS